MKIKSYYKIIPQHLVLLFVLNLSNVHARELGATYTAAKIELHTLYRERNNWHLTNRFRYFHGFSRQTNYHNMAKRIYVSYFCWKQNRLTVVSSPNINRDGCKLCATFKKTTIISLSFPCQPAEDFRSQNYYCV